MAVFIDFILTFSLLAPLLVLLSAHCAKQSDEESKSIQPPSLPLLPPPHLSPPSPSAWILSYADFLHSTRGRISAIFVAIALYSVGISGVLRLTKLIN